MAEEEKAGLSKSAKRRAAQKKAKEAAAAEEEPPAPAKAAPPAPAPAKAASKAKAKPAAAPEAAAQPKAPAPEAAAKAKGKAKGKAAPKEAAKAPPPPEPEEPKPKAAAKKEAAAKPAAKQSAAKPKAKAEPSKKQEEEEEERKSKSEPLAYYELDDGTGGDWELSTGLTKKQQKQKERKDQEIAMAKAQAAGPSGKRVPGMGPAELPAGQYIPGMPMPKAGAGPAVSQSVNATLAAATAAAKTEDKPKEVSSTMNITVPEHRIGVVIGPKGKTIKLIQEKTGVTRIDTSGDVFTIMGPPKAVEQAYSAIQELIEKGYTCMAYDDGREEAMMVHPSTFPDIIGKQGKVIRALKEHLDVEVSLPEVPKNTDMNTKKKYKITIAGSSQKVEQAKAVINDILMYYHSEITHPGEVHEELEVDSWALRYLIGTKGSELKHIQNNYKVRVAIPREHSVNQKVCIVGEPRDVERAKIYAEKVIWNANQPKGRDKNDDGDVWGGEDEEESWMSPYLYKRKD